jgi:PAS domain S-box-containing protein
LVFLDAHETLAVLQTSDGKIAESAFHNLIEKPINSIAQKCNGNVYAFGEMVDLLAQRREYHFALALEARWNKYMEHQSLTLLCGYDLSSFEYRPDGEVVQSICHLHSHVDYTVFNTGQNQNAQNHHITIALLEQRVKELERELERRKASEASLHTSLRIISENAQNVVTCERETYQNVLSTLPVGVYGITFGGDEDFYVNKRFCELVGREDSDIRKRGWIDVIHPDDRKEMESKWPVCHHHGSRDLTIFSNQHEYRLIHADNSVIWVKAETAATNAENGNILGYIHTIMDITELKQTEKGRLEAKQAAEEHQRHRAEEAERHKQMQDQWIDSLCHEVRSLH